MCAAVQAGVFARVPRSRFLKLHSCKPEAPATEFLSGNPDPLACAAGLYCSTGSAGGY